MRHTILLILIFIPGLFNYGFSQELTQTVRGTIIDKQSRAPIEFANVLVVGSDPHMGTSADENGKFRLEKVPVGRITLQITSIGYTPVTVPNIVVNSGKETVLTFELEEEVTDLGGVTISNKKGENNNDLIGVSAKVLTIDQTNRYAGTLGDPSRMVSNFAGVVGGNDQRNDIIIRGNSPLGVLWRLEGADIPNPNHFAGNGTTGGPVSILNNNLMANSDFMTGAFPSPYGNALSGAFDIKLRSGNNEKREYTGQIGFNGFEFGAEGPLNIKNGSSFLISYRYSALDALDKAGISFGESTGIPRYQDLTFKLDYPKTKIGKIAVFGIGGMSSTEIFDSKGELDTTKAEREDIDFNSKMGVLGLTHTYQINKKTYIRSVITQSYASSGTIVDTFSLQKEKFQTYFQEAANYRTGMHSYVNKKVNAKNAFRYGLILSSMRTDMQDRFYDRSDTMYVTRVDIDEQTNLVQSYANWQYKPNSKITINTGLHYSNFLLNSTQSVEPRVNANYQLSSRDKLSFGYGLHSQLQPLSVYYTENREPNAVLTSTNKDLDFTKSHHLVLGYSRSVTPNVNFKAEAYYQNIYDIPVEMHSSSYSLANFGADFGIPLVDSLVNNGTGTNYGIELTLERYYSDGYYYLVTTSLFQSKYKGSDNIERNTAFNGNYVFNALFGKEIKLKNNKVLNLNIKQNGAGGRRFVPIDLELSRQNREEERDESRAYEGKYKDYFRTDLKIGVKKNTENYTSEWGFEIQNVFGRRNILTQQYNPYTGQIEDINQLGIFPIGYYRINF